MGVRRLSIFLTILLVICLTSSISSSESFGDIDTLEMKPSFYESEVSNIVENGDFETGDFSPWINSGDTTYNQIQSTTVYNGTYSLYLDSHLSSAPYEPVYQELDLEVPFSETHRIESAIYPTKVGNTCGQAGVSELIITIMNIETKVNKSIFYEWSGYTYPGGDLGSNVTHVRYLLFDWTANSWNLLNRSLYDDYVAFYGAPSNISEWSVQQATFLSHSSNGDPGDFYVDDFAIGPIATSDISPEPDNIIENPGFETGSFYPWINYGDTSYNTIQSSVVYNGTYALYMDSHVSSAPYEPVIQIVNSTKTLSDEMYVSVPIYPTAVGATCGQAGSAHMEVHLKNNDTDEINRIFYEWSGYTFPDGDLNSNVTYARYLLFDWTPNTWNILNRSLLDDYTAFFGAPTDPENWVVIEIQFEAHSSNGDPGDFYVDHVFVGNNSMWVDTPDEEPDPEPLPSIDAVENSGFESGSFIPWINLGDTSWNSIGSANVFSGTYSLFMDSHVSSSPYEPVKQRIDYNATLGNALRLIAAIYPTAVGPTCGQAGVAEISVTFENTESGIAKSIAYQWSGYTFPGGDLNANVTYARYLLFDWTPNTWNILNRSLADDFVAFFGAVDLEEWRASSVSLLCHSSNGDPGDFYADDIHINSYTEGCLVDLVSPEVDEISNQIFEISSSGNIMICNAYDQNPESFEVFIDDALDQSDSWNGSDLILDIDVSSLGNYNYTLYFYDAASNMASESFIVIVSDTISPDIVGSGDFEYEYESTGHYVNWTIMDATSCSYEVYLDDTLWSYGPVIDNIVILSADGLEIGVHNYTILVIDEGLNSAFDTIFLEVIPRSIPEIEDTEDFSYEAGSIGNSIEWNGTTVTPYYYEIYLNELLVLGGPWDGGIVDYIVDGLDPGVYNYTIIIYDMSGDSAYDSVIVTVADTTPPTINHPADITLTTDELGTNITWVVTDLYPGAYHITRDSVTVSSGICPEQESYVITLLIGLTPGVYEFQIIVHDLYGNAASDTVFVTILSETTTTTDPGSGSEILSISITVGSFIFVIIVSTYICRSRGQSGFEDAYSYG